MNVGRWSASTGWKPALRTRWSPTGVATGRLQVKGEPGNLPALGVETRHPGPAVAPERYTERQAAGVIASRPAPVDSVRVQARARRGAAEVAHRWSESSVQWASDCNPVQPGIDGSLRYPRLPEDERAGRLVYWRSLIATCTVPVNRAYSRAVLTFIAPSRASGPRTALGDVF